jgi:hypothetical protein
MSKSSKIALALVGLAIALPASAQQPTNSSNEPIVIKKDRKVVCKFEQNTGTRFQTRSCKTIEEWDTIREQQLRAAQEMINRSMVDTRRGN